MKRHQPNRDDAEAIAIRALAFLAGEPERLQRFLDLAGIAPDEIRVAAASPGFLAGVLDHIMSDEAVLLAFAANTGHAPEKLEAASRALAGRVADDV